jgi:tight adherence protein C
VTGAWAAAAACAAAAVGLAAWSFGDEGVRRELGGLAARGAARARLQAAERRRAFPPARRAARRSGFARVLGGAWEERRLRRERDRARSRCLDDLGELIDVVALGMSAGVSFDVALELYCGRYRTELAQVLAEAMQGWRLGVTTRRDALLGVAARLDIPAFTGFVETVTESLEFGAPVAQALARQAQEVREERRRDAEERIQKAPVKMLVPTSTLVLPALILSIMGPILAPLTEL